MVTKEGDSALMGRTMTTTESLIATIRIVSDMEDVDVVAARKQVGYVSMEKTMITMGRQIAMIVIV